MDKQKFKILLNSQNNASSEDIDLFLQFDLHSTFSTITKERYDNNFDLSQQFEKERNASRNFRVYGEITSTVIDCDNLIIRVFSDEDETNEITTIQTTKVSYGTNNVFGKKKGKYLLELDNFQYDTVHMLIESDNFSYQNQRWSQQLVFFDAENNFIGYGNETVDLTLDAEFITIENDFPFFFNKHWVRLDYNVIEEKVASYSWNIPSSNISEGQSVPLELRLNKPSPFGNEQLTLQWSNATSTDKYYQGSLVGISNQNPQRIFPFNVPTDSEETSLNIFNGNAYVLVDIPTEKSSLFTVGQNFKLINGPYQGNYTIVGSVAFNSLFPDSENASTVLILNTPYDNQLNNTETDNYYAGSFPDIKVFQNNIEVEFPLVLNWNVNEQIKPFIIEGKEDFEIEFDELFQIESINLERVVPGAFPTHSLTLQDSTIPRKVRYHIQEIYENRLSFTGRTAYDTNAEAFDNSLLIDGVATGNQNFVEGPAVLRNGLFWQGRNEEFYPNDFFNLTIINEGIKTVIPTNPDLGILEPQALQPQESFTTRVNSRYEQTALNSYKLTWTALTVTIQNQVSQNSNLSPDIAINGSKVISQFTNAPVAFERFTYSTFKSQVDGGSEDIYVNLGLEKPFSIVFDDETRTAFIVSLNSGVKLDVDIRNPFVTLEELTSYVNGAQITKSILLNSNSNENQEARYTFIIDKPGFKSVTIPASSIQSSEGVITNVFLTTGYSNILYPYDQNLNQCFFALNANNVPGVSSIEAIDNQTSYMERGNVYVNGVLLLSSSIWPGGQSNITEPFITDEDPENILFSGAFLPSPIEVIPCTQEIITTNPTRGIWRILIRDMSNLDSNLVGNLQGTRSFNITFGTGDGAFTWIVGGSRPLGPAILERSATDWWNGSHIPVQNNETTLPAAILKQRLDEGGITFGTEIPEGPLEGILLSEETLELRSKIPGFKFNISNLQNFNGFNEGETTGALENLFNLFSEISQNLGLFDSENNSNINPYALRAVQLAPALNPGELNTGRNGLGGFSLEIE